MTPYAVERLIKNNPSSEKYCLLFFILIQFKLINNVKIESDKGFTLSLEVTAKAHRLKLNIIEIPAIWMERDKGKSRFKLVSFFFPYMRWFFYIIKTSIFHKNAKEN